MKKLLCVLICIVMIAPVIAPLKASVEQEIRLGEVASFCEAVTSLCQKYDNSPKYSVLKYDAEGKEIAGASFNRLIVRSEDAESQRAIDKRSGMGYTVFQYACRSDMISDLALLTADGKTVQSDNIFYCCADSAGNMTSYKNCFAEYTKNYFESLISSSGSDATYENEYGNEIVVGIMDSGIDSTHGLFAQRIEENNVNFSSSGDAGSSDDDNGHGTAVASVVVQSTPNNVKVKPYKVIDDQGVCSSLQILAACEYILACEDKPDIINISFTGYSDSDALIEKEAVERLVDSGITVCVSAGNDFVPVEYANIASSEKVITVSSHSEDYSFSSFSCYGDGVDICAPGEDIYCAKNGGGYEVNSGTSFSAPFVSAACAFVLMQDPGLSPGDVKEKIKNSAVYMGKHEAYYYGSGVLNMRNLIENKTCLPPAVSVESGTYSDNIEVAFSSPYEGAQIYYTVDGTIVSEDNGIPYFEPVTIENDTLLTYAVIRDGEYLSDIRSAYYTVKHLADEQDFIMDSDGTITACTSEYKNIIVPDTIGGITPTAVGNSVFKGSDIMSVELPDTVKSLGESCFEDCKSLKYITAEGVVSFSGKYVFSGCSELRREIMPNLKQASDNAFYGCSKLHGIDFEASLESIESQMFAKSGLLNVSFSKSAYDSANGYYAFRETPIRSCNISQCDTITSYMFDGCRFLNALYCENVSLIMSYAFRDCNMLRRIGVPNVEKLSANALDSSYFDVFYAPKCTTVDGGKSPFSKYSYITVLDLPALADKLCTKWMAFSTIEKLYLDSVTELSVSCFTNTPKLSTVYLPNAKNFYSPYINTLAVQTMISGNKIFKEKPPMKIVWIPKAQTIYGTVNLESAELFFAPSSSRVYITIGGAEKTPVFVVSPDILRINFSVINSSDYDHVVVSAPDCSLSKSYGSYEFISCNDILFTDCIQDEFIYKYGDLCIEIPSDFAAESWNTADINKSREASVYQFVLDTVNDNIINAKDYSVINHYTH